MAGTAISVLLASVGYSIVNIPRSVFEIGKDNIADLNLSGADYVINAAGMINRPVRERLPDTVFETVNAQFPHDLAKVCKTAGSRLIHISTDCVFDGQTGHYFEDSPTTGTGIYSTSKRAGEPRDALVLRLSMVGPERRNFYSLLCWFLAQKGECNGYLDHHWNGLTTPQLAHILDNIMRHDLFEIGVRHIFSDDITKCGLIELFQNTFDHQIVIHPVQSGLRRDMRLRTHYPDFLASLDIQPLQRQVFKLRDYSDARGRWTGI